MFGSTLAIAFLSALVGCRVYRAPMRILKGLWGLVKDEDDQIVPVTVPLAEEQLAISESGISRHAQTMPIKHYWTWSAVDLRAECVQRGIYHGQLKAQMIVDLLVGAGQR